MGCKVFVGNLSWEVDLKKLKETFSGCGEIEDAIILTHKDTGKSKGFGFITFRNEAAAEKALKEMNGKALEGREMRVVEAKVPEEREEKPKKSFKFRERF